MRNAIWIAAAFVLSALPLRAEDAEGCKDSPLFTRMPGSELNGCDKKDFDEVELTVAVKDGAFVSRKFEGQIQTLQYTVPEGKSELQILRNYEAAFRKAGFESKLLEDESTAKTLTAHRTGKDELWLEMKVAGGALYTTIVRPKAMEQEVSADASALLDELNKSGHVAVYGINFATGKAEITPESDKVLGQVRQLLQDNAELKLRIEGHTDNQGARKANLELSKKRAAAVKAWLAAHGVDAGRLTTDGFGDARPLAENSTDEGRAKNRRVELVKR